MYLISVGAPLITAVFNRKILFEPNAAVTIQERLQFEKYFLKNLNKKFAGQIRIEAY